MKILHALSHDGEIVPFESDLLAMGATKDVHFTRDHRHVVAWFRDVTAGTAQFVETEARLLKIVGPYREQIFEREGGAYWRELFCWPEKVVTYQKRIGVMVPVYPEKFFFKTGAIKDDMLGIKGSEKQGKWFTTPKNRFRFLDPSERGKLPLYLRACLLLSRALRRLHAAGLAHSDLSYRNVLIDPLSGSINLIDLDGLVVPGLFPPMVLGTPDFVAPEVVASQNLPQEQRVMPSRSTDLHALAVLIYVYLLCRHPLRGKKVHAEDPLEDDLLTMGNRALYIEHPTDASNRLEAESTADWDLPWLNTDLLPAKSLGPYLDALFQQAFVAGLHDPQSRPLADAWEAALIKTMDLLLPCANAQCPAGAFIYPNVREPVCPYCQSKLEIPFAVFDLYRPNDQGSFSTEDRRIVVREGSLLFKWHVFPHLQPNEFIKDADRQPVARIIKQGGGLALEMLGTVGAWVADTQTDLQPGQPHNLAESHKILFAKTEGGRLFRVTLLRN